MAVHDRIRHQHDIATQTRTNGAPLRGAPPHHPTALGATTPNRPPRAKTRGRPPPTPSPSLTTLRRDPLCPHERPTRHLSGGAGIRTQTLREWRTKPDRVQVMTTPSENRFTELYVAHYADVLGYLLRRTSRDDAVDVAAEVFVVVWRV